VGVLKGLGGGVFAAVQMYPAAGNDASITADDFDGDGTVDLAVSSSPPMPAGVMSIVRGLGDGSFLAPTSYPGGDSPLSITSGDFKYDNQPDIAIGIYQENAVRVFTNMHPAPDSEDADGDGVPDQCEACYADFTGDGALDLFDFLAYVNAFNGGADSAECDGDAGLTLFDFLCFVNAFNAGC
jgi:hypothetical protein